MKDAGEGRWIETYSGIRFSLSSPRPESVLIEDVAHGLSLICRYVGQCDRFYSVAEHSVLCADLAKFRCLSADLQMACLMHDAAEAYTGDTSGPMKMLLRDRDVAELDLLEDAVQLVVLQGLGLDHLYTIISGDDVKRIDDTTLAIEESIMMPSRGDWLPHHWPEPPADWVLIEMGRDWQEAKKAFLDRYHELREGIV